MAEEEAAAPPPPKPYTLCRILLTLADVRELHYFPRAGDGKISATDRVVPMNDVSRAMGSSDEWVMVGSRRTRLFATLGRKEKGSR